MKLENIIRKICSILLVLLISCSTGYKDCNPLSDYICEVYVTRILDGDTFEFLLNNEPYKVRALGVDAFESKENARLEMQAERSGIKELTALKKGLKAKVLAEKTLLNRKVLIKRDSSERNFDVYNRLLRWIIVDGKRYDSILIKKHLGE